MRLVFQKGHPVRPKCGWLLHVWARLISKIANGEIMDLIDESTILSREILVGEDSKGQYWAMMRVGPFDDEDDADHASWLLAGEVEMRKRDEQPTLLG